MKYRFTGNKDVPDWLLGEIPTMARVSCVRTKLICKQVVIKLLGGQMDIAKIRRLTPDSFEESDLESFLAALHFLLFQAARHAVDAQVYNQELQQLGLPRENSDGISRPYRSNQTALIHALAKQSLPLPRVEKMRWRIDCIVASSHQTNLTPQPTVHLNLSVSHGLDKPAPLQTPEELGIQVRLSRNTLPTDKQSNSSMASPQHTRVNTVASLNQIESGKETSDILIKQIQDASRCLLVNESTSNASNQTISLTMDLHQFKVLRKEMHAALNAMKQFETIQSNETN